MNDAALFAMMLIAAAGLALAAAPSDPPPASPVSNPGTPWPATDALGRIVPLRAEAGPSRAGRFAGIFYFLWHERHPQMVRPGGGPYDISRIMAGDPEALKKPESPLWGKYGVSHYWGEPIYGYYLSDDPWVLRRHAHLLADAGVDTLIFDTTNAVIYEKVFLQLCEVFTQVRKEGGRTPAISFMVNTEAGATARKIYDALYKPGRYRDLWFHWQGKPLMICDPAAADPELREFFTLRRAHWPFEMRNTDRAWHWEATFPQPYGYVDDPKRIEQVNVSVAQNLRASDGAVTNMSFGDARGRGFHSGKNDSSAKAIDRGANFGEQWTRAFELDPPFVMVTGWNEWIAGRWGTPDGPIVFVDQFDREYSRDIEPMKGGHGDSFYYQLVSGIRRYKGVPELPKASGPKTIRIDGRFEQWASVRPEFRGHVSDTKPRSHDGAADRHYESPAPRNNLLVMKVARDAKNLYFHLRARDPIDPNGGADRMWLLIDTRPNNTTGGPPKGRRDAAAEKRPVWEGFDFLVNRARENGRPWIEKNLGGWRWARLKTTELRIEGRDLHLSVPRHILGLAANAPVTIDFKWIDGSAKPGDLMDVYTSGDAAPPGRFRFRYTTAAKYPR